MSNEHDLPQGQDWIPDVLPSDLLTRETEYHFGNGFQMALLRIAEAECDIPWQDLVRKYMFLGVGSYLGRVNGEYQFIRRVGEDERAISLEDGVEWEGTHWKEIARPNPLENEIIFKARDKAPYKLLEIADNFGVSIPNMLERALDLGLRMSYELRYRDDIAYYLKTHQGGVTRIDERKLGNISSDTNA